MAIELQPFDFFALPSPVYMEILHQAISTFPPVQALNLRLVNRFFDRHVCLIGYARNGISLRKKDTYMFFDAAFLSRYVLEKVKDHKQSSNEFVKGIKATIKQSMEFMKADLGDNDAVKRFQSIICDAIAIGMGYRALYALEESAPLGYNPVSDDIPVSLAAALGAHAFVKTDIEKAISGFDSDSDQTSNPHEQGEFDLNLKHSVFGEAVLNAAFQGHLKALEIIADYREC